jgi:hypothetical protein
MEENLYAPPKSTVADVASGDSMSSFALSTFCAVLGFAMGCGSSQFPLSAVYSMGDIGVAPGTSVLKIKAALDTMREALRADMTSLGEAGV